MSTRYYTISLNYGDDLVAYGIINCHGDRWRWSIHVMRRIEDKRETVQTIESAISYESAHAALKVCEIAQTILAEGCDPTWFMQPLAGLRVVQA